MRSIDTENLVRTIAGQPHAIQVPIVPDDASPGLRVGLMRRRVAALHGRCPCGARRPDKAVPDPGTGMDRWRVDHRPTCPAHDDPLSAEIERWQHQEGAADDAQAG